MAAFWAVNTLDEAFKDNNQRGEFVIINTTDAVIKVKGPI